MIEFKGEISKECQNYIRKKEVIFWTLLGVIMSIILIIPIVILGIFWNYAMFIALIAPGIYLTFFCVAPWLRNIRNRIPLRIEIHEDDMFCDTREIPVHRSVSQVKKVVDMGDWYDIIFYFPHKYMFFICQKNLLLQGTIDEFEGLFPDKIKRISKVKK